MLCDTLLSQLGFQGVASWFRGGPSGRCRAGGWQGSRGEVRITGFPVLEGYVWRVVDGCLAVIRVRRFVLVLVLIGIILARSLSVAGIGCSVMSPVLERAWREVVLVKNARRKERALEEFHRLQRWEASIVRKTDSDRVWES